MLTTDKIVSMLALKDSQPIKLYSPYICVRHGFIYRKFPLR